MRLTADDDEWDVSVPADASEGWVTIGEHHYPAEVIAEGRGRRGAPDVRVTIRALNGAPAVTDVRFTMRDDGRPIRSSDLNRWRLENVALAAFRLHAKSAAGGFFPPSGDDWLNTTRELDGAVSKRRPPTRAELEEVADVYKAAHGEGRNPTQAVFEVMQYGSYRTAARRVEQARRVPGLLPKTSQGKARG